MILQRLILILITCMFSSLLEANENVYKSGVDSDSSSVESNIALLDEFNRNQLPILGAVKKSCPEDKVVSGHSDQADQTNRLKHLDGSFVLSLINPEDDSESFIFFESKQYLKTQGPQEDFMDQGHSMDLFAVNKTLLLLNPDLTQEDLDYLNKEDWVNLMTSTTGINKDHAAYESLQQVATTREILSYSTEVDILNAVTEHSRGMSYEDKTKLLKRILSTLSDGYDDLRTIDGSESAKGVVGLEEVFSTWKYNVRNPDMRKAGVCRDIADAGVKISKAMGIRFNYALGFQTVGDQHHRIVILSEGKANGLDHFNYGEHIRNGEHGIKALEKNGSLPSNGIKYRIYNHYSQLATILPSELGVVLNDVTGGEEEVLTQSPLRGYSKHQIGYASKDYGRVRVFHTRSSRGQTVETSGVSYNVEKGLNKFLEVSAGAATYHSTRDTGYGTLNNSGFSYRVAPKFKLDIDSETTGTKLSLHVTPQVLGIINCSNLAGDECVGNSETHKVLHSKASVKQSLGPYFNFIAQASGNTFYYNEASTDNDSPLKVRMTNYSLMGGVEIKPSKNWVITTSGKIIYTDLGDHIAKTYMGELDIEQKKWGVKLGAQTVGTTDKEIPEFIPGAQSLTVVRFSKGFEDVPLHVGGFSEFNHEDNSQNIFGVSLSN